MLIDKVVVNSSPLIVLFRSGLSDLLPQLFNTIVVPDQVYKEIAAGPENDVARKKLPQTPWIEQRKIDLNLTVAAWNLGDGESAVFSFVKMTSGFTAVVDDLAARRCARVLGIKTLGTGSLLLLAKQRGIIQSVNDQLKKLLESGLYLSDPVVKLLISEAGE